VLSSRKTCASLAGGREGGPPVADCPSSGYQLEQVHLGRRDLLAEIPGKFAQRVFHWRSGAASLSMPASSFHCNAIQARALAARDDGRSLRSARELSGVNGMMPIARQIVVEVTFGDIGQLTYVQGTADCATFDSDQ
jgi:hypothetical protein